MRIFVTVTGSQGHARTLFPLVREAARAGHEVLVATSPQLAGSFAGLPVQVVPVLPDLGQVLQAMTTLGSELDPDQQVPLDVRLMLIMFAGGPHVSSTYRIILPIARRFRPDVVLRDGSELAACLVAEALGVPHINAPSGPANVIDPQGVVDLLNERRAEVGLPIQYDPWAIYRYGRFECMPARFPFTRYDLPAPFVYSQALLDGDEGLSGEYADLAGGRPMVLATMGSALPTVVGLRRLSADTPEDMLSPEDTLAAVVAGLSQVDCAAVVATGGFTVPSELIGPHVRLVDWVPQTRLLRHSDLFVTHAGYNGVRESMRLGVPMAMIPQFGDQYHNAERVTDLKLGLRITDVTAAGVAEVCRAALEDDRIRANAAEARQVMENLPTVGAAVDHLLGLCA